MQIRFNSTLRMTPTRHEKLEWARMAQAAYAIDRNDIGHRFSGAASIRDADDMPLAMFDELQGQYRAWLIDNVMPGGDK